VQKRVYIDVDDVQMYMSVHSVLSSRVH